MPGTAAKIRVSEQQLVVLSELRRSRSAPRGVVQRASIIELGFRRLRNVQIFDHVKLNRQQVGVWRQRWRDAWEALCVWESNEPHRLRESILEVLSDAPRPGSPGTFTAEQVAQIVALACESPKLLERPINRWTHKERACQELCVRQDLLKLSCGSVECFWHSVFEEDGEVVEGFFPLRDGHRPVLRGFVDRHVDQLQCRLAVRVLFSVASDPQKENLGE